MNDRNEFATGFNRAAGCGCFVVVAILGLIFLQDGLPKIIHVLFIPYEEIKASNTPRNEDPVPEMVFPPHRVIPEPEPEPVPLPKPKARPPVVKARPPLVISPKNGNRP